MTGMNGLCGRTVGLLAFMHYEKGIGYSYVGENFGELAE